MPVPTIADWNNGKTDLDHIAEISTSLAPTAVDRLGHTKQTVAGAIASIATLNNRGAWAPGVSYVLKDLVLQAGTWYVAVLPGVSSAAFATDAARWQVYQGITAPALAASTGSTLVGGTWFGGAVAAVSALASSIGSSLLGFIQSGVGAVARSAQDKMRDAFSPKDHGCVLDGVTDDAANFLKSLTAAAGRPIRVAKGDILRLASQVSYSGDIHLYGGGKVLVDFAGVGIEQASGDFVSRNIQYDGNSKAISAFHVGSANLLSVRGGSCQNFDSNTFVRGFSFTDAAVLEIDGVRFKNLTCLANGVVGDTNGAVRAIYGTGVVDAGLVQRCRFENINNRTAGGAFAFEDADAIHFQPVVFQHIAVKNNRFINCGKRWAKFQGPSGSVYKFSDNVGTSPYTGTVDDVVTTDNGMYACVSIYGGDVTVENNKMLGGVCGFFVEISGAPVDRATVRNNRYVPEYHKFVGTSLTRFAFVSALNAGTVLDISDSNESTNTWNGINGTESLNLKLKANNNDFSVANTAIFGTTGTNTILSNRVERLALSLPATVGVGVFIPANTSAFDVSQNDITSFFDGISLSAQAGAYSGRVLGNRFATMVRNDISEFTTAPQFMTINGNITDKTTMLVASKVTTATTVGAAGGASALPATPTGYKQEYIAGTIRKIPYYTS